MRVPFFPTPFQGIINNQEVVNEIEFCDDLLSPISNRIGMWLHPTCPLSYYFLLPSIKDLSVLKNNWIFHNLLIVLKVKPRLEFQNTGISTVYVTYFNRIVKPLDPSFLLLCPSNPKALIMSYLLLKYLLGQFLLRASSHRPTLPCLGNGKWISWFRSFFLEIQWESFVATIFVPSFSRQLTCPQFTVDCSSKSWGITSK